MKAILLAAGRGTRISRHIDGKPKCTVPLDGSTTLIEYSLDLLRSRGIQDITLALGYRADIIREITQGRDLRYVENPFFDVTNSIASLWFARHELDGADRFVIMNGDVFLSAGALDVILAERRSPVFFYDVTRKAEADYKFQCEGDRIVKYGKNLTVEETSGEYIGAATFGREFLGTFLGRLEALIQDQKHGCWWEDVVYSMAAERPVIAKDVEGTFWGEVDYVEDYQRIMDFYQRKGIR